MSKLKFFFASIAFILMAFNVQSQTMEWVLLSSGEGDSPCESATDCNDAILCYGLQYTPAVSGVLTSYTTGFWVNCVSSTDGSPVLSNASCVLNDNSAVSPYCAEYDTVLFYSSGNAGVDGNGIYYGSVPVTENNAIILHQVCFTIPGGEYITIKEEGDITLLTTSINLTNGGFVTEYPSYNTTTIENNTVCQVPTATNNKSVDNPAGAVTQEVIFEDDGDGSDSDPNDDLDVTSVNLDATSVPGGVGTDTDADGDIDQVVVSGQGTWNADNAGNVTFTPLITFTGDPDPITYTIRDLTNLESNPATITVDYEHPPVAVDDNYITDEDTPVTLLPLSGDSDLDSDILTVTSINGTTLTPGTAQTIPVTNGTVTIDVAGVITFIPAPDYHGQVTFPYVISDGNGGTATANEIVTVNSINDLPVADDDVATTPEDTPVTVDVTDNDDFGGDGPSTGTITIPADGDAGYPSNGDIVIDDNGTPDDPTDDKIVYTPDPDFHGTDVFTYEICDSDGDCDEGQVDVTISGLSDISGTVFDDQTDDGTVNGTGTNVSGALYVNLLDDNNVVVATIAVNSSGEYNFSNVPGGNYTLQVSIHTGTIGLPMPTTELPQDWNNNAEHLGAGSGDDGSADGLLNIVVDGVNDVEQANFGIAKPPDVTPIITAVPSVMQGVTEFYVTIEVTELIEVNTSGLVIVKISKDNRWDFNGGAYDPNLTEIGSITLDNSDWTYSDDPNYHIFTSNSTITAGSYSIIGFYATWDAGQTKGDYTITSQITSGSGGEIRINNNVDAEFIQYFFEQ